MIIDGGDRGIAELADSMRQGSAVLADEDVEVTNCSSNSENLPLFYGGDRGTQQCRKSPIFYVFVFHHQRFSVRSIYPLLQPPFARNRVPTVRSLKLQNKPIKCLIKCCEKFHGIIQISS